MDFPPYTHVPSQTPHPINDPKGHSFGRTEAPCGPPKFETSIEMDPLRIGRELFDAGYYWEAHEAWEGAWNAAGRTGPIADAVKALIKLAAAGVKIYEGQPTGAQRHARRCIQLLESLPSGQQTTLLGMPTSELKSLAHRIAADPPSRPDSTPGTPTMLMRLPASKVR
jgi:predicted metal-dependent hydrolase